ncbi:hypothetical protein JB92DRAFT_2953043 [Gautieria morchelliformis]|nr:hypothetical protein JB92DRAFT_2953043 [Gautieria morchelliformis]
MPYHKEGVMSGDSPVVSFISLSSAFLLLHLLVLTCSSPLVPFISFILCLPPPSPACPHLFIPSLISAMFLHPCSCPVVWPAQ